MSRKTISVPISTTDPVSLVKLAKTIASRQAGESASKAVGVEIDTVAFAKNAALVEEKQIKIENLGRELEELTGSRNQLLGIAEGQTSQTEGTLLFEILRVRDLLLGASRGNEKALEPWGFNVTLGEAKSPARKAALAKA